MINNLARERFGSPSETPKNDVENSRIGNYSDTEKKNFHKKKPTNIESGHLINFTEKSDHANSTLMDGLSLGHDHHFANIVSDELEKSEASKNRELESKNSNLSSRSKKVAKKIEKYGGGSNGEDVGK
jgi:hypothetical protein